MLFTKTTKEESRQGFPSSESSFTHEERRHLDLVRQVLNDSSNVYQEFDNVNDLFKIYNQILSTRTSSAFKSSLNNSEETFKNITSYNKLINNLEKNNPESFIIMPLIANNHMFGCVIRKNDNEFSATIVNKGARHPNRPQFQEFIVPQEKMESLINVTNKYRIQIGIEQIYQIFDKHAKVVIGLNAKSRDQKFGNCFIKEPENAIKYAFATRKFSKVQFDELRNGTSLVKFKPKWDYPTEVIHMDFVSAVRSKLPNISNSLNREFEIYSKNKKFRDLLEKNLPVEQCLIKAFDSEGLYKGYSKEDRIKLLLSQLNLDTIRTTTKDLPTYVNTLTDEKLKTTFNNINKLSDNENIQDYFRKDENFSSLLEVFTNSKKMFPNVEKQLGYEYHLEYYSNAAMFLGYKDYENAKVSCNKALTLYPYNVRPYLLKSICDISIGEMILSKYQDKEKCFEYYKKAIEPLTEAIQLNPKFASAYGIRSQLYELLGMKDLAAKDLTMAKSLDPEMYKTSESLSDKIKSLIENTSQKKNQAVKKLSPQLLGKPEKSSNLNLSI